MGSIVITGGAGFIGSNLANSFLSDGHRVTILDSCARPGVERNVEWLRMKHGSRMTHIAGDVRDQIAVREALRGADRVFHFAGQVAVTSSLVDPREDFTTNVHGTFNVLEAIRQMPVPPPLVFTSTNKVYGSLAGVRMVEEQSRYVPGDAGDTAGKNIAERGIAEDRGLDFHSPYGCSKGSADQYVLDYARSFGLPSVVFRMSCICGPRQFGTEDQGWVAHFLKKALHHEPITLYGDGKQVRDILAVEDLVRAFRIVSANAGRLKGRVFNVGGGPKRTASLIEMIDLIGQITGRTPEVTWSEERVGDQKWYVSNTEALRRATGWEPALSLSETVQKLHQWLVSQDASPVAAMVA